MRCWAFFCDFLPNDFWPNDLRPIAIRPNDFRKSDTEPTCCCRNILRFSNNHYFSQAAADKQARTRARSGRQTPLPPSGKLLTQVALIVSFVRESRWQSHSYFQWNWWVMRLLSFEQWSAYLKGHTTTACTARANNCSAQCRYLFSRQYYRQAFQTVSYLSIPLPSAWITTGALGLAALVSQVIAYSPIIDEAGG